MTESLGEPAALQKKTADDDESRVQRLIAQNRQFGLKLESKAEQVYFKMVQPLLQCATAVNQFTAAVQR